MKKFFAVCAAVAIAAISCMPAFAAGLNSAEQSVLASMRTPANMNGNSVYVPASYINQAEAHFNTIDMTDAQASEINGIIATGRSFLESTGKSSVSQLTSAEFSTIAGYASAAAAVLDMSVPVGTGDDGKVKIVNKNGEVVIDESNNIIKPTGSELDLTPVLALSVTAGIMLTASAAGVLAKKALKNEEA